MPLEMPK